MVAEGRSDVAGIPATVDHNVVPLPDDALVIDDDIGASLDKDYRDVTMPARLIYVPPYNWQTHCALTL